jgi:hypothetical protein
MANEKYLKKGSPKGTKANKEAPKKGRMGDTVIGHLTKGEVVLPVQMLDADNHALRKIVMKMMTEYGVNPNEYTVGHKDNKINPETGYPEFWGWNPFKAAKKVVKNTVNVVKKVGSKIDDEILQPVKKLTRNVVDGVVDVAKAGYNYLTKGRPYDEPDAPKVNNPSTAGRPGEYIEDPSGKKKKSALLRRRARGKRRLRVGEVGTGGAVDTGVGTGGASGGAAINVPRG